jgi:hypothetical protein
VTSTLKNGFRKTSLHTATKVVLYKEKYPPARLFFIFLKKWGKSGPFALLAENEKSPARHGTIVTNG